MRETGDEFNPKVKSYQIQVHDFQLGGIYPTLEFATRDLGQSTYVFRSFEGQQLHIGHAKRIKILFIWKIHWKDKIFPIVLLKNGELMLITNHR
jgi:hypothetical protein